LLPKGDQALGDLFVLGTVHAIPSVPDGIPDGFPARQQLDLGTRTEPATGEWGT
jgi:hypothetical protein